MSVVLGSSLAGCDMVDVISNGLSYSRVVETDLEQATGLKPEVGFNWRNGSFQSVTVTFPRLHSAKPLDELADTVREIVARDFKQTPDTIVLAFSLHKQRDRPPVERARGLQGSLSPKACEKAK